MAKPEPKPETKPEPRERTLKEAKAHVRALLTNKNVLTLVARALPSGVDLDPLRLAYQAITLCETPDKDGYFNLLGCTDESIVRAVLKAATAGLEFSGGQAFLIPYGKEASCDFGVWGMVAIADRTGKVKRIWSDVVYEADTFKIVRGEHPILEHDITDTWALPGSNTPIGESASRGVALDKGGRGLALGSYACCELLDGTVRWEAVPEAVLAAIRADARSKNSPSHRNYGDDMRRKIAVKRASKLWPRQIVQALELDDAERLDDATERAIIEVAATVEQDGKTITVPAEVRTEPKPDSKPAAAEEPPAQRKPPELTEGQPDAISNFLARKKEEATVPADPEEAFK